MRAALTRLSGALAHRTRWLHTEADRAALEEELRALSGSDPKALERYRVRKTERLLVLSLLLALICIPAAIALRGGREELGEGILRPDYGESARSQILGVTAENETEVVNLEDLEVTVSGRAYSPEMVQAYLEGAREELEAGILGDNASADAVRTDLSFPGSLQEGRVSASYLTFPYGYLSEQGRILQAPEEGELVEIRAELSCQGETLIYEQAVLVLPPVLDGEEALRVQVEKQLREADAASAQLEALPLPEEAGGRTLHWYLARQSWSALFLLMLVAGPALWGLHMDEQVHTRARERSQQLLADYPQLVWKLTMLLGAGMTIHDAFFRIASGQKRETGRPSGDRHYVYEEMRRTCRQIEHGASQARAYEQFGRRCALPQYVKLGTLLSQGLRKGSQGLADTLEKEMQTSMEERRSLARAMGERAGTKLLFPMMLMLGVVLVILILPALLGM